MVISNNLRFQCGPLERAEAFVCNWGPRAKHHDVDGPHPSQLLFMTHTRSEQPNYRAISEHEILNCCLAIPLWQTYKLFIEY